MLNQMIVLYGDPARPVPVIDADEIVALIVWKSYENEKVEILEIPISK